MLPGRRSLLITEKGSHWPAQAIFDALEDAEEAAGSSRQGERCGTGPAAEALTPVSPAHCRRAEDADIQWTPLA